MDILKMSNISKSFFGVNVLNSVSFSVAKGEVHALLGENGAGKSTLMNILAGVHARDGGVIEFDGEIIEHNSVKSTEDKGIAFVHQELNLINDLKVYENIFLRKELLTKFGSLNKKLMIEKSKELFEELGVDIDPKALVANLDTSKKQLLEIAKALFGNAKLLILDEPTTALNNNEIDHLFAIVRRLKQSGKSFIFISHKMTEIFDIADSYTVLRNGEFVGHGATKDINAEDITKLMVGSSYSSVDIYEERTLGEPILEIEKLCGKGFSDIDLCVKKGEILGLTGLKGAGVSELMQTIFGISKPTSGKIKIDSKEVEIKSVKSAMKNKIAMIASNRKENSIIPDFSLLENMYVAEHALSISNQSIYKKKEKKKYDNFKDALNIKANNCDDLITSLSGGNQQKIILARWLNTDADIILMDNPTQGIDVGAKAEIYKLIHELARSGKTILVNTLEIPEIHKIADRCVVFYHGEIKVVLKRNEITEQKVMMYATNAIEIIGEKEII